MLGSNVKHKVLLLLEDLMAHWTDENLQADQSTDLTSVVYENELAINENKKQNKSLL